MSPDNLELLPLPDVSAEDQQAQQALDAAKALDIVDTDTFRKAGDMLRGVNGLRKKIETNYAPVIEAAHRSHKAALTARDEHTKPLAQIESVLRTKVGNYEAQERARIEAARRAEEKRVREETERIRREQEAERRRIEDERMAEAQRLEQEAAERAREAAAARAANDQEAARKAEAEAASKIAQAAAVVEAPMAYVPPAPPAPPAIIERAPTLEGMSFTERWHAELQDKGALVRHALASDLDLVEVNMAKLNDLARKIKGKSPFPGVAFVVERTPTIRGSR